MFGSDIYNDFSQDIYWIRERLHEATTSLPESLKPLVEYYIHKRLIIIPDKSQQVPEHYLDYQLGRPVPYATFWFADAFGLADKRLTRRLGLGLTYSALATTIRDDIMDKEAPADPRCVKLSNYFNYRYVEIFTDLFDRDSKFWYYFARCVIEQAQYEKWHLLFSQDSTIDPFSELFLEESSRYFSAVVLPPLAAVAILAHHEKSIPRVIEFLRHYSMGWRIYDDLMDWRKDLKDDALNHSSILLYILHRTHQRSDLNEETVLSMFLNHEFLEAAYKTILRYTNAAKNDVAAFNSTYLSTFMEEQISFHSRRRDSLLARTRELKSEFLKNLTTILKE